MSQIKRLTVEQESMMPVYADKWIKIGLSTEPADRENAEAAFWQMYKQVSLPLPEVIWFQSPVEMYLWRKANAEGKQSNRVFWGEFWDKTWTQVWEQVDVLPWEKVGKQIDKVVWRQVWKQVAAQVKDEVETQVEEQFKFSGYGQHSASWLSFYDYSREVLGLKEQTERMVPFILQAQCAGWYYSTCDFILACERHNIIEIDEQGRLHNIAGAALAYPNGWAIYAIHGTIMAKGIIQKMRG